MSTTTIQVPDDATLLEISQLSQAQHLHLITDGTRSVLSPVVPKGWSILLNHNSRNAQLLNQKLNQAAA